MALPPDNRSVVIVDAAARDNSRRVAGDRSEVTATRTAGEGNTRVAGDRSEVTATRSAREDKTRVAGDRRRLGHLLRRAAFGARPAEWATYNKLGIAGTTNYLLHPETQPDHLRDLQGDIAGDYIDYEELGSLRKWWVYRMMHTSRPLEEKMVLFWHNHFATANFKVDNPRYMWQQNELFRTHALGNFRALVKAVSRDPAMLIWLDGDQNKKGKPNENFGRELLELFTMGIGGGYTEQDVKEAARAFTGWRFDRGEGAFTFDLKNHDDGPKTFLGETGNFNGDDLIDIVVRHPSTAKFLCTKLFRFFVHDDPTKADIEPLTKVYFSSAYDMRAVVGAILTSPAFYSDKAMFAKIKSPTEFVITTLRTLDAPLSCAPNTGETLRSMGQELFNPPNVKGWAEGQTWVNTMSLLARMNFAGGVIKEMQRHNLFGDKVHGALATISARPNSPEAGVDALWELMLPGHKPSAQTRAALVAYASDGWSPGEPRFDAKAPGMLNLILSAPEYQLA